MKYGMESRPWGMFTLENLKNECKVKRITVAPGQKLSYQYHHKRQEQWTVIKGNLTIVLDDEKIFRSSGESVKIPLGARHRAWNREDKDLIFIEVQHGDYFGEDDIVRIEDDYNRE
jgi:mannose-6-phosphate isomerase